MDSSLSLLEYLEITLCLNCHKIENSITAFEEYSNKTLCYHTLFYLSDYINNADIAFI